MSSRLVLQVAKPPWWIEVSNSLQAFLFIQDLKSNLLGCRLLRDKAKRFCSVVCWTSDERECPKNSSNFWVLNTGAGRSWEAWGCSCPRLALGPPSSQFMSRALLAHTWGSAHRGSFQSRPWSIQKHRHGQRWEHMPIKPVRLGKGVGSFQSGKLLKRWGRIKWHKHKSRTIIKSHGQSSPTTLCCKFYL